MTTKMKTNPPKAGEVIDDDYESDADLIARHARVKDEYQKIKAQMERMKLGPARTRKAQWGGCIHFTLLQIESEMKSRGLKAKKDKT